MEYTTCKRVWRYDQDRVTRLRSQIERGKENENEMSVQHLHKKLVWQVPALFDLIWPDQTTLLRDATTLEINDDNDRPRAEKLCSFYINMCERGVIEWVREIKKKRIAHSQWSDKMKNFTKPFACQGSLFNWIPSTNQPLAKEFWCILKPRILNWWNIEHLPTQ